MNYFLSTSNILGSIFPITVSNTQSTPEIEMIELTSWEWFLLLSIVILVVWLLILFQIKFTDAEGTGFHSDINHELES